MQAMSNVLEKPVADKPLLAKRRSIVVARTTYRVSKAQSLRMRAADQRAEAAEAKKAKAAEKQAKADNKAGSQ
jgi:hypothetical protein